MPFEKGKSGNPEGRPKRGHAIADILNELGSAKAGNKTRREQMLANVYKLAQEGEKWAVEFIADRTEGKPTQTNINIEQEKAEVVEIG